jgi:hypothetical protein
VTAARQIVCLVTVLGCRDRQVSEQARPSPIETGIARDLTARFGTPATVKCQVAGGIPVACTAKLADGTALPIALEAAGKDEWGWRVDGLVIESKTIVAYVQEQLAALNIQQTATCGPPIQALRPGERVSCTLSGGGGAFVQVAADGSTSLELLLDGSSAAERGCACRGRHAREGSGARAAFAAAGRARRRVRWRGTRGRWRRAEPIVESPS